MLGNGRGGVSIDSNGPRGHKCYKFNGDTSYIELSNCEAINQAISGGSQAVSFAFWLKHNDTNRALIFGDYSWGSNS